jgi:hypothetical protein
MTPLDRARADLFPNELTALTDLKRDYDLSDLRSFKDALVVPIVPAGGRVTDPSIFLLKIGEA